MIVVGIWWFPDPVWYRFGDQPHVRDGSLLLQLQDHQQDRARQGTKLGRFRRREASLLCSESV